MKLKTLLLFIAIIFSNAIFSKSIIITPKFDKRVELLSIVFRLADAKEYQNNTISIYTNNVDSVFNKFRNHEVVKMAKKLRETNSIAYDAIMSLAIHLKFKDNTLVFNPKYTAQYLDGRWEDQYNDFIVKLNKFYKESNFNKFYLSNSKLYKLAEERFKKVSDKINIKWFENFFGYKPEGTYNILLSFTNRGNYGPKVLALNKKENLYSILCAWQKDTFGLPIYNDTQLQTMVHEFCHSFCNQLGNKIYPEIKKVSNQFFNKVKDKMYGQAYTNSLTMINEFLVRACTIKYLEDNGVSPNKIKMLLTKEEVSGFIWINKLYNSLIKYSKSKSHYKTLDLYLPNIIKLINNLEVDQIVKNYIKKCPKIKYCSLKNKSKIDSKISEIIIEFDKPMKSYGVRKNKQTPELKIEFINKAQTKIAIKPQLKPNKKYCIDFFSMFNKDTNGYPLHGGFKLSFSTK